MYCKKRWNLFIKSFEIIIKKKVGFQNGTRILTLGEEIFVMPILEIQSDQILCMLSNRCVLR